MNKINLIGENQVDMYFNDQMGFSYKRNYSTNNKNAKLHYSHYSDPNFNKAQFIFGQETNDKDLWVNYDDRLWQADYSKHEKAIEKAKESGFETRTANFYEAYLSAYHEQPVQIIWIMAGTNVSNGYEYLVFGYKPK